MQAAGPSGVAAAILARRAKLAADGFSAMLLFCNSAATTLVGTDLDEDAPIPILSPLIVFRALGVASSRILLIGSRTRALAVIEQVIRATNPHVEVAGFADPLLIAELEDGMSVAEAYERSWLSTVGRYSTHARLDAVAICCTHLTGVDELVARDTDVPVVDVGRALVELASGGELVLTGHRADG